VKLLEYIKKHKAHSALFALAIFLLPIIIIHCLFKLSAPCNFLAAEWSVGELLEYCGAILGAIATIIALIATIQFTVKQNRIAQEHEIKIILADIKKAGLEQKCSDVLKSAEKIKSIILLSDFETTSVLGALFQSTPWNSFFENFANVPSLLSELDVSADKVQRDFIEKIVHISNEIRQILLPLSDDIEKSKADTQKYAEYIKTSEYMSKQLSSITKRIAGKSPQKQPSETIPPSEKDIMGEYKSMHTMALSRVNIKNCKPK